MLRVLRELAADGPVALAIDDVQWLDPVSARALRYALRRMGHDRLAVIATQRTVAGDSLTTVTPSEQTLEIVLGGLDDAGIRQLVAPVMATLSRPKLAWISEMSAGNPMFALELARSPTSDRMSRAASRSLRSVVSTRLADVAPAARGLLQTVAALGAASPELLARASPSTDVAATLTEAVERHLLTMDSSMVVRCAHPLLGSVALAEMEPVARRDLHARLVELVTDPDERARHVALSRTERDAAAAAELEAASRRTGRRGAPALAADFAAHSVRLTALDDARALIRRTVSEILHRAAAGETARAISMVDAVLAGLPPGRDRVAVMTLRVGLDFGQAVELLDRAEREAQGDELLRGRILDLRAYHTLMYHGRVDEALRLESEALDIARRHHDDELEMLSSATLSTAALFAGAPQPELLERASELSRPGLRLGRWPDVERARQCLWNGELGTARRIFEGLHEMTVRSGIEFQRPYRLLDLAMLEIACGNLEIAAALADDALESANDAGNQTGAMWVRYPDGLANAHLGNSDRARRAVDELAEWGRRHDEPTRLVMAHHVAGVLALATGDPAASLRELEAAVALDQTLGGRHPGGVPVLPDAIEAAAAAGAAERAGELLVELGAQSATLDVPWVHAVALRARGVVGAVTGDSEAPSTLAAAAEAFDAVGAALDAARACWWRGRALRRTGRRHTATEALVDARRRFEEMGAAPWARTGHCRVGAAGSRSGVERPDGRRDGCRVTRRRRGAQSRDRRRALRERGHGRGAPHEGVPQARCPVAHRARAPYG